MLPLKLIEFFFSGAGKVLAAGLVVVGLVVGFAREQVGARKQMQKTETANAIAKTHADRAAARARDPGARGLRDPYALD